MISMGIVWDRATEFLSDHLAALLPIVLLAIFVPISISQSLESIAPTGAAMIALPIVRIGLSILTIWGQLAVIAFALDPVAGRAPAVAAANRALVPVLGLTLLLVAGFIALVLPLLVALIYSGFDLMAAMEGSMAPAPPPPPGLGWFVAAYLLLLLALLLWLCAKLVLLNTVVVAERRWLGAIARSFVLTRRVTLKIIGMLILYVIVALVSFLAAKFVFGSLFTLLLGGEGNITLASVLTSILVSAVLAGFSVLAGAFTGKLYLAIRDARDAIVESI